MLGFIDSVRDGQIRGWILDDIDGRKDLSVIVLIDESPVTVGFVTQFRQDLLDCGLTDGMGGFIIPFTALHHKNLKGMVRLIEAKTGWQIPPGPIAFDPSEPDGASFSVAELEPRIAGRIERILTSAEAQQEVAVLARLFGLAIDRARALEKLEQSFSADLWEVIERSGGLGGLLGHLSGAVSTNYPRITFETSAQPLVSIIIPVHDKFSLTYDCLRSIYSHSQKSLFEIIIVDDLSSDETLLAALVFLGPVRIVRNSKNLGFVGSCNAGAAIATGSFLFFLNNDTLVRGDWLDALVETFEDDRIGVVGSRLLFGDGRLQECGGLVWNDGTAWNWGRNRDAGHPDYRYMRPADYVSGAALMIRASLFRDLGGFDRLYEPAYYEDTDLCFRVREAGYSVVVQPASTIIHLEGQSNGCDLGSGLKRYQAVNHIKFFQRWRERLKAHRPNGVEPDLEALRGVKMRALFVDDTTPTPDQDAGSNAALEHMQSLQRLGYHVVFVPSDNMADIPHYTANLEKRGIECVYAPYYWSIENYLRLKTSKIDVVYLHRYNSASKLMALIRSFCPDTTVIYNVADLHSLREERERALGITGTGRRQVTAAREFELIAAADATIVHSTYERDILRKHVPDANAHCVAWPFHVAEEVAPFDERSDIAFVGGYGHPPNVDAMLWFTREIQPLLQSAERAPVMHMIGSNMPQKLRRLETESLRATGYVADLATFLGRLKATVAPLRYGAGLKGKVLTSFASGTPCVMTSVAAEGMDLPDELGRFVVDTPEEIAEALVFLTSDEEVWTATSNACVAFMRQNFSSERIDALLKAVIDSGKAVTHGSTAKDFQFTNKMLRSFEGADDVAVEDTHDTHGRATREIAIAAAPQRIELARTDRQPNPANVLGVERLVGLPRPRLLEATELAQVHTSGARKVSSDGGL